MDGKPFDGAISAFYRHEFPKALRREIEEADKSRILSRTYPYETRMKGKDYNDEHDRLQIELVKMLSWVRDTGARVAIGVLVGMAGSTGRFSFTLPDRSTASNSRSFSGSVPMVRLYHRSSSSTYSVSSANPHTRGGSRSSRI